MQTELVINRGGFPPFSARECQQTLQPLETGELRRTVNGELIYTGYKGHHKYRSTISCKDQAPPALEGIWRGEMITVQCLQRLWQEVMASPLTLPLTVTLERAAVPGSVIALKETGTSVECKVNDLQVVLISNDLKDGDKLYISYRPQLQMRVVHFQVTTDEWQQTCGWQLHLEEV